jgi:hypothetical protein
MRAVVRIELREGSTRDMKIPHLRFRNFMTEWPNYSVDSSTRFGPQLLCRGSLVDHRNTRGAVAPGTLRTSHAEGALI